MMVSGAGAAGSAADELVGAVAAGAGEFAGAVCAETSTDSVRVRQRKTNRNGFIGVTPEADYCRKSGEKVV